MSFFFNPSKNTPNPQSYYSTSQKEYVISHHWEIKVVVYLFAFKSEALE